MKPLRTKIVGLLLVIAIPVFAQDDPGDDPDAPIDGGIILLIAGGIGYGMKTAYNRLKKDQVGTENQD